MGAKTRKAQWKNNEGRHRTMVQKLFAFSSYDTPMKSVTLEEEERGEIHIFLLTASCYWNMALLHHFKWHREIFFWSSTCVCLQNI